MIHRRAFTRPMPSAYALRTEMMMARIETIPLMKTLFHSFCGKATRFQKLTMPSK